MRIGRLLGIIAAALLAMSAGAGAATPAQLPGTAGCVALKGEGGCAPGRAVAGAERAVAVSPDGKSVYLVAQSNPEALEGDAIDVFDRDPTSGALTQKAGAAGCFAASGRDGCGKYQALHGAHEAAVSPDGRNVYVTTGAGIVAFSRDPASGALTPLPSSTECLGGDRLKAPCRPAEGIAGANSLTFSPDGAELYVTSNAYASIATLSRDPVTGALQPAGCVAASPGPRKCGGVPPGEGATDAIVAGADGRSIYAIAVDLSDEETVITRVDAFARRANGVLRRLGGRTGCLHPSGPKGCPGGRGLRDIEGLALSPDGRSLYVTSHFGDSSKAGAVTIFRRAAGGALSQPPGKEACISANGGECATDKALAGANGVAVSPDGTNLYATGLYGLAVLDRSESGALTAPAGAAACLSDFKRSCTQARGLEATGAVTVSPDGRSVYVTSFEPGGLAIFSR
jgi:DNA-binding beta-propeller fold protein YncE